MHLTNRGTFSIIFETSNILTKKYKRCPPVWEVATRTFEIQFESSMKVFPFLSLKNAKR
jgi:hypothetical protein